MKKINFCSGWYFKMEDAACFEPVYLPHDYSISGEIHQDNPTGGSGGYLPAGKGVYKKNFTLPKENEGNKFYIEFEGIYERSRIYVNDILVGKHNSGYSSFCVDITKPLNFDGSENTIMVFVDNSNQPNSRWYTGSGIYRPVWLMSAGGAHIAYNGVYCKSRLNNGSAFLSINTKIVNLENENKQFDYKVEISYNNEIIKQQSYGCMVKADSEICFDSEAVILNPLLWSTENPALYDIKIILTENDEFKDEHCFKYGFREIAFDKDKGFIINGKRIKLNGVCLHHDAGCVGAAVPKEVMRRRLELLIEMGVNSIRTSHNAPSPEFLDLCDELGLLVMDVIFDEWEYSKVKNLELCQPPDFKGDNRFGFANFFSEDWKDELISTVIRDRNHPCVIIWSLGNEIPEQGNERGVEILKQMIALCRSLDDRAITVGCDRIESRDGNPTSREFLALLDVVGYNYPDRWEIRRETCYEEDRIQFPDRKMLGTEVSSVVSVRGVFEPGKPETRIKPYYHSMIDVEQLMKFTFTRDYIAGDYMWTGIDYLGESRWPGKNTSCGQLDTCGFKKMGFYFYKSQWNPAPMVKLFPHWNWEGREGEAIPVVCFTNCEYVELFLNGKSYGTQAYEFPRQGMTKYYSHYDKPRPLTTTADLHLTWHVPYEPGELTVIGYRDGVEICRDTVKTAGAAYKIKCEADKSVRGNGVIHITVTILDENNNFVHLADNPINFELEGKGEIIGVDNGNPRSSESFKGNVRKAFNGMCLAIVRTWLDTEGDYIKITAKSPGLIPDVLYWETK